jgi:hypothetical protein
LTAFNDADIVDAEDKDAPSLLRVDSPATRTDADAKEADILFRAVKVAMMVDAETKDDVSL